MNEPDLPPRPEPPDPRECCQSGCDPCILDYYSEALAEWERKVAEIKARQAAQDSE